MSDFFEDENAFEITRGNGLNPPGDLVYRARQQNENLWTDDVLTFDGITNLKIKYDTDVI